MEDYSHVGIFLGAGVIPGKCIRLDDVMLVHIHSSLAHIASYTFCSLDYGAGCLRIINYLQKITWQMRQCAVGLKLSFIFRFRRLSVGVACCCSWLIRYDDDDDDVMTSNFYCFLRSLTFVRLIVNGLIDYIVKWSIVRCRFWDTAR